MRASRRTSGSARQQPQEIEEPSTGLLARRSTLSARGRRAAAHWAAGESAGRKRRLVRAGGRQWRRAAIGEAGASGGARCEWTLSARGRRAAARAAGGTPPETARLGSAWRPGSGAGQPCDSYVSRIAAVAIKTLPMRG
jgi:hypothetical protein